MQDRENIDLPAFARRVREARLDQGLTQEDLAARLDRSVEGTARLERGKTLPHPHTLRNLADELDTTVLWLLRGQGPKYPALENREAVVVGDEKKG